MQLALTHWLFTMTLVIASVALPPAHQSAITPAGAPAPVVGNGSLGYQVSPDERYVVYDQSPTGFENFRLYSKPLQGGAPVELSTEPSPHSRPLRISPNGNYVVYRESTAEDPYAYGALYTVPISGTASPTQLAAGDVAAVQISPDSRYIVYRTSSGGIYSRSVDSNSSIQLASGTGWPSGTSDPENHIIISSDSRYVVYKTDLAVQDQAELFSVPLNGGVTRRLNLPIPPDLQIFYYLLSPDGKLVVYSLYRYDPKEEPAITRALVSASIDGSSYVSLKETLATGTILDFQFTSTSQHVMYRADQDGDGRWELYAISTYPLFLSGSTKALQHKHYLPLYAYQYRG